MTGIWIMVFYYCMNTTPVVCHTERDKTGTWFKTEEDCLLVASDYIHRPMCVSVGKQRK